MCASPVLLSARSFSIALALTALPVVSTFGQTAEELRISGQPLTYVNAGKVEGCGVRLVAVAFYRNLDAGRAVDVSIDLRASGPGAIKALSYDIDAAEIRAGWKPRIAKLDGFWIKAPGEAATYPQDGQFQDSEDMGGRSYAVSSEAAWTLYEAIFEGASISIGVKRFGERGERIYFGKVEMSEAEERQALNCLMELGQ